MSESIPPSPTPTRPVSAVDAVAPAIERVKELLFRPFDLYRWVCIGFTAWLATLLDGGGGGGGGFNTRQGQGGGAGLREQWEQFVEYLRDNLNWILPLAAGIFVVLFLLGLVLLWLSSRGRFMFLHNVARNRADVVGPWHAYREHGFRLFLFRLVIGLATTAVIAPALALGIWATVAMVRADALLSGSLAVAIATGLLVLAIGFTSFLVDKLTKDFVVPIMFLRGPGVRAAWREYLGLLSANPGAFIVYLLFHLLLTLAVAFATLAVILLTCCVAGCLLALPFIGTVVFLPVLVFFRAFSAGFLAQFGPEYDVFRPGAGWSALPPDPHSGSAPAA